jgi:hypothetical protein
MSSLRKGRNPHRPPRTTILPKSTPRNRTGRGSLRSSAARLPAGHASTARHRRTRPLPRQSRPAPIRTRPAGPTQLRAIVSHRTPGRGMPATGHQRQGHRPNRTVAEPAATDRQPGLRRLPDRRRTAEPTRRSRRGLSVDRCRAAMPGGVAARRRPVPGRRAGGGRCRGVGSGSGRRGRCRLISRGRISRLVIGQRRTGAVRRRRCRGRTVVEPCRRRRGPRRRIALEVPGGG